MFNPSGGRIRVTLAGRVDPFLVMQGGQRLQAGPCSLLLSNVTTSLGAAASGVQGQTSWCRFSGERTIDVLPGPGATVVPQSPWAGSSSCDGQEQQHPLSQLLFRPGVIRPVPFGIGSMPAACVLVEPPPPSSVVVPTPVLQAPADIGPCDAVEATAEASFGSLGRPLRFQWSLMSMPGASSSQIDAVSAHLAGFSGRLPRVSLPFAPTAAASSITLQVAVANFLSTTVSTASVTIRRVSTPVPVISVQGGSTAIANSLAPLELAVTVRASPCGSGQVTDSNVTWANQMVQPTSGVSHGSLAVVRLPATALARVARDGGRILRLPAGSLRPGRTYAFRATVRQRVASLQSGNSSTTALLSAAADVSVQVRPSGLVAGITGGPTRVL